METMIAFLTGAVTGALAVTVAPAVQVEPIRKALVDVLATTFVAGDRIARATKDLRSDWAHVVDEARAKARGAGQPATGAKTVTMAA